jgi:protein-L-isoaspartate(D-aspartate) O-methyltransferase
MPAYTANSALARTAMVEQQVRPWDVHDPRVLAVLGELPRDAFVAEAYRGMAYADLELPIGHGQKMMKPVVEGRMLQALAVEPGDSVLEIGTGSGFITACLGRLAREVTSLEIVPALADAARRILDKQGLAGNVCVLDGDALAPPADFHERRFDAICVTGAVASLPAAWLDWLRPGGRLFVVRGIAPAMDALRLTRREDRVHTDSLFETQLDYLVGAAPVPQFRL